MIGRNLLRFEFPYIKLRVRATNLNTTWKGDGVPIASTTLRLANSASSTLFPAHTTALKKTLFYCRELIENIGSTRLYL